MKLALEQRRGTLLELNHDTARVLEQRIQVGVDVRGAGASFGQIQRRLLEPVRLPVVDQLLDLGLRDPGAVQAGGL